MSSKINMLKAQVDFLEHSKKMFREDFANATDAVDAANTQDKINILVKKALYFLSQVDYKITGNFIDLYHNVKNGEIINMIQSDEINELKECVDDVECEFID